MMERRYNQKLFEVASFTAELIDQEKEEGNTASVACTSFRYSGIAIDMMGHMRQAEYKAEEMAKLYRSVKAYRRMLEEMLEERCACELYHQNYHLVNFLVEA